ncbi:hypothetical protein DGWBC_1616 [Dehalogenimonas sp. WBC-2]|nr:hypothetical protein DGWBC_1616 [Dehalogenimonas sp. WBC-2]
MAKQEIIQSGVEKRKKSGKWSPDLQMLHFDFFCHLTYMAAIATSGISRSGLFNHSAKIPLISAHYFQKINVVARAFNHDYAESCRIVGEATKEPDVKALLLRLSGALASGEDIAAFLEKEAEVASEKYGDRFEGAIESLKKWTDAYVALIMTSAIVAVMTVITMIIGSGSTVYILGFGLLTVLVTLAGVWLIYSAAPREPKVHSLPIRSREQNLANRLFRICVPLAVVLCAGTYILNMPLGISVLAAGLSIFPFGLVSMINDSKIDKYESDIGGFLRSLGGVTQATNITVNEALTRIDFRSMVSLKDSATLLYTRLQAGIEPKLCWDRFVAETGSEMVARSVRIFLDSISIGGEAERVGRDAGFFALKIALLRIKRSTIATGFTWLAGIMHIVLVVLVLFIFQTIGQFSDMVREILPANSSVPGAPSFGIFTPDSGQLGLLQFMVIGISLVLSVSNATAVYATGGGHYYKLFFYLAVTLSITGAALLIVPVVVAFMFNMMN